MAFNQPLTKNGEGYNSPTEFKAIRNIMRGNGLRNGEIWETENKNGVRMYVIVLAEHERFSQILTLKEYEHVDSIAVTVNGDKLFTSAEMVTYTYNEYFTHFVRCLDDDKYEDLLFACMDCLGVPYKERIVEKVVEVPVNKSDQIEMEILRTKMEMYKQFYDDAMKSIKEVLG